MTLRPCLVCHRPSVGSRCPTHMTGWQRGTRPMPPGWSSLRGRVAREEPSCRVCGAPTEIVDHIVNRARARQLGWSEATINSRANLQALCRRCSNAKTAIESHEGRKARQTEGDRVATSPASAPIVNARPSDAARVLKPQGVADAAP